LRESANIASGIMTGFTKGMGRILLAGFRSPFEVTLSAARGFHNTPLLYGDETVRPLERITGIRSGIEAAGKVSDSRRTGLYILADEWRGSVLEYMME